MLLRRYELFGWDYALINPVDDRAVEWYLGWARSSGGPVLELACGTGRLVCRLAGAGFEVTGLDLCRQMLDVAEANVSQLPPEARRLVTLLHADMSDWHLDRRFGLIIIADNSFRELLTRQSQLACLRCVREHLRREGKQESLFAMAERRFDRSLYSAGARELGWSEPVQNPKTGETVRRRGRFSLDQTGKWIEGEFEYELRASEGRTSSLSLPMRAPVLRTEDYLELFRQAGLAGVAYADYEKRPADGSEYMTCFVCGVSSSVNS